MKNANLNLPPFTPGPWFLSPGLSSGVIWNIKSTHPHALAGVFHAPDTRAPLLVAKSNALVIAAAPLLLKYLRESLPFIEDTALVSYGGTGQPDVKRELAAAACQDLVAKLPAPALP